MDAISRLKKAVKIDRLFARCVALPLRGRMLEVGAGSGQISAYFAAKYQGELRVDAVDVADQRVVSQGFDFRTYDGQRLPFDDDEFDLIVSNHVIEHVGSRGDQEVHLRELARVLKPDGVIYLAAPSKWQFIEPHFRLAGLSWIPRGMRDRYVRLAGKGEHYDCNPMGHLELELMAGDCGLQACNINVDALHALCEEKDAAIGRWLRKIPNGLLQVAYRISPTMVYLLKRQTVRE
ncbi:class I SAM-dependent methyltransferase [Pseudoxanthomonas sp.]|uniref:class I SAM-dependent methyltransferase n=1 Tax=Pseudoxanthomonas sp. TaxID=1871049 RepID=UPI002E117E1E|nr:class I SAM-dependent methyltransferase [Pseudoxanthomonas sp.]